MNKFSEIDYITSLCNEVLGPHFTFVKNSSRTRTGFIYCEHFYGKGFAHIDVETGSWNHQAKPDRRRRVYPGAVARLDNDALYILDQTRTEESWNKQTGSYADAERLVLAQPNFVERFKTILATHKKVCKARKLRSDGMHRIIA